jgi:SAM-dependent methyltransferase
MSRTATSVLLSAWVAVTLLFAASCSNQPAGTVQQPADTVQTVDSGVQQAEATEPVEPAMPTPEAIDEPLVVPEDPIADPADMLLEPADLEDSVPSVADSLDDLFFGMDGQTEKDPEEEEEGAKKPDVIFVPTPQEVVDRMLELVQVTKDDVVYDLGCGDGRIVATAAKKYGCKAFGFDVDPQRIEDSLATVKEMGVEDLVEIRKQDIFTLDLTPASVITLYLLPELNVRLIPQLDKLKPGTRIVSHAFDMRGVKPVKVETIEGELGSQHTIYMWTTPLDKQDGDDGDDGDDEF